MFDADAEQRRLFVSAIDRDFSVIAPAGVGKTNALVERMVCLAEQQPEAFGNLYVITYTKKAALSLKNRTLECLRAHSQVSKVLSKLPQTFFGTIHSLCWKIIQQWDSASYELLQEDTDFKNAFLDALDLQDPEFVPFYFLFRFIDVDDLLKASDGYSFWEKVPKESLHGAIDFTELSVWEECLRAFDVSPILNYQPTTRNQKALASIESTKHFLQHWFERYQQVSGSLSLPECFGGGVAFQQVFEETFRPFYQALSVLAMACVQCLSKRFFNFRREKGTLSYDDCIIWAEQLLQTSAARDFYAQHPVVILLDEAQDTDPVQFHFLQTWWSMHPQSRFSMVGDPQQSIYSERADVQSYVRLHQKFVAEKRCQPLVFSKTFRCPSRVVSELNVRFSHILSSQKDALQVDFVPLQSAVSTEGDYQEIPVLCVDETENPVTQEARVISSFLKDYLSKYSRNLSDICFLSPRKDWLQALQQALSKEGWKLQVHSGAATGRENPLFCHVLAMVHEINFPEDTLEKVGLLQSMFGCSEEELTQAWDSLSSQNIKSQSAVQKVQSAKEVLQAFIQEIAVLSLCRGIMRLIDFFQQHCESTSTDAYFIDVLMKIAFQTQQQGKSWMAFETRLKPYLKIEAEIEEVVQTDALQGFSCHKAKGLEWKTVFLPFFDRPNRFPSLLYPRIFHNRFLWRAEEAQEIGLSEERRREFQRLLYVACTRAKEHLFILRDKELWVSDKHGISFGSLYDAV